MQLRRLQFLISRNIKLLLECEFSLNKRYINISDFYELFRTVSSKWL